MNFWNSLKSLPWARIGLSVLCGVLAVALIAGIFVTAFVEYTLGQIGIVDDPTYPTGGQLEYPDNTDPNASHPIVTIPPDDPGDHEDPPDLIMTEPPAPTQPDLTIQHKDIVNIMLVGMDRRPNEGYLTRSDAMILCTINTKANTITMTSFLRDIYVQIPGHGGNKLNAAYAMGGMKLLSATMKANFGVVVDQFITVDFSSFPKIVDILGGVSINLRQDEADYLNNAHGYSLSAGTVRLNGEQALNYSRIRYIGTDFERTLRQRKVLTSIMNSCKSISAGQAMTLINEFLPLVQTNIDKNTLMRYAIDFLPVLVNGSIVSQRIPLDGTWSNANIGNVTWTLWIHNMWKNLQYLYDTLMPH